jgi:UDP-N-acetylmuramate: L-alanyl-gamma-D-glutamyl-meso-diaminopimelate ligase
MHIHVLGVCGTFMAGVANIAIELGHKVTGCDQNIYPPMSSFLESLGIKIYEGYNTTQTKLKPDLFIIGNVVSRGNNLMEEILNKNLNYQSAPEWLYQNVLKDKWVIAVSGTHGKTTTTSMINWIMQDQAYDCGYLIGGIPGNFKTSSKISKTKSPFFVIEADEYDTAFFDKRSKFVHYHPKTLIINNIEFDHADIFRNIKQIFFHFHQLIRLIPANGKIIVNKKDNNINKILEMGCWSEVETFNSRDSWNLDKSQSVHFDKNLIGKLNWKLFGKHNELNALAAIAAVKHIGINPNAAIESLKKFKNSSRRLQLVYESKKLSVYDDFAHHPTAIKFIIESFKNKYHSKKTLLVIDPRSNTMKRGDLKINLGKVLSTSDGFIIYSKDLQWEPEKNFDKIKIYKFISNNIITIENELTKIRKNFENIVFLSNGSFDGLQEQFLKKLKNKK